MSFHLLLINWLNNSFQASLQWQLVGSATGKTAINLPSEFNELYIEVHCAGASTVAFTYVIPYIVLTSEAKGYRNGAYGNTLSYSQIRLDISKTICILSVAQDKSGDVSSTTITNVYYR